MGNIRQSTKAIQAEIIEEIRQKKIAKLQAENKKLKAALKKYGRCKDDCAYVQGLKGNSIEDCDCGFEKAVKGE